MEAEVGDLLVIHGHTIHAIHIDVDLQETVILYKTIELEDVSQQIQDIPAQDGFNVLDLAPVAGTVDRDADGFHHFP